MHLTEHCENDNEDQEEPDYLPFQIDRTDKQPLSKECKRQHKEQIENYAVNNVLCSLLHVRIGSGFIAPCRTGIGVENAIIVRLQRLFSQIELLCSRRMQLIKPLINDSVFLEPLDSELIQSPHILGYGQRSVAYNATIPYVIARTLRIFLSGI